MSRFFSNKYQTLTAYVPGEQPQNRRCIKLNTNESPFPPSPEVCSAVAAEAGTLNLYPDPESRDLTEAFAAHYGVGRDCVLMTNGSDEILNFAFMAFCDADHPAVFPAVTYGFYSVFSEVNFLPYEEIPLQADFTVRVSDYLGIGKTVFLANPNAPTGIPLLQNEIEQIVCSNPDNIVVVDEAYVDFGAESCVALTRKYKNLLVTQTCSKSRGLAGARLGYGIADPALIADLNTIKYSTNPYNVNRMTAAAGIAAIASQDYYTANCKKIIATRDRTADALRRLGFTVLPSATNFLFAKSDRISGERFYREMKQRDILIRHFTKPGIENFNRITIGTDDQMNAFLAAAEAILKGSNENENR